MPYTPKTLPSRSCRYCKAKFRPVREDQRFCKADHRKAFWKYGSLPFDKMRDQLEKHVRKVVHEAVREELALAKNGHQPTESLRQIVREEITAALAQAFKPPV